MRKFIVPSIMLSALLASAGAFAADNTDTGMTSTAAAPEVTRGYLSDELVSIKPQAGVIGFSGQSFGDSGRLLLGITADANLASMVTPDMKSSLYIGPQTGILYSHLGGSTSNFFGANTDVSDPSGGTNFLIIPTDLKLGWNIGNMTRISAHGGGNVVYRSIAERLNFGPQSVTPGQSQWSYYPNAGLEFEASLGKSVALDFRPDWTFTPGNDFYTLTLGLGILLS